MSGLSARMMTGVTCCKQSNRLLVLVANESFCANISHLLAKYKCAKLNLMKTILLVFIAPHVGAGVEMRNNAPRPKRMIRTKNLVETIGNGKAYSFWRSFERFGCSYGHFGHFRLKHPTAYVRCH